MVSMKSRLLLPFLIFFIVPLALFPIHHYLHKKHSDLVPALTEALAAMEAEGRLEELREEFRQSRAASITR
jgi:hypothetical protein